MKYIDVRDAKDLPGMRLALTTNVCGPWSESAKYILQVKQVPFTPVAQYGGQENEELIAWTGHGNAPVLVWENEQPRTGWAEILMLAERIAPTPALLPGASNLRAAVFGIANEIAGEWGFGWCRRVMMLPPPDAPPDAGGATMAMLRKRYGNSPAPYDQAPARCVAILDYLKDILVRQQDKGSRYFVGDALTAADIYWAAFSQLLQPLVADLNPINETMRKIYGNIGETVSAGKHPILLQHRDYIFRQYIPLPLDFNDSR